MSYRVTRPLLAAVLLCACAGANAQVVISEFRTRGPSGGNDEFVEIHNIGAMPADISGWKINGSNAAGTTGTRATIPASTTIGAGCSYLLANNSASGYSGTTAANQNYTTGITDDGGIALLNAANAIQDAAGMNAAAAMLYKEGTPLTPLAGTANQAYERKPGGTAGHAVDTNNNVNDFALINPSSPRNSSSPCIVADAAPTVNSTLPLDGATGVAVGADITITFSEAVSVSLASFALECPAGAAQPFGVDGDGTAVITLDPTAALPAGVTCNVEVIAAQVADTDGTPTPMAANHAFSFTTQAAMPVVSIVTANVVQAEGNAGSSNAVFTLAISPAPAGTVSFDATLTGSGANPADAADFAPGASFGTPVAVSFDATSVPPYQVIVPINGDTDVEPNETFTLTLDNFAGTDAAQASPLTATGTIQNDDALTRSISQIQGTGWVSPFANGTDTRIANALVTAVTVTPPAALNGFFVQSADVDADNDELSSEGLFVETVGAPTVAVGDSVTLVGKITESFNETHINQVVSLVVNSNANPLPTPVVFGNGVPSTDPSALSCPGTGPAGVDTNFECFEGMRVAIANGLVTRANLRRAADLYAEAYVSPYGKHSRREQGVLFPSTTVAGNAAAGQFDSNPEILEIDGDEAGLPIAELTSGTTFDAIGVIGYSFGDYEFYPVTMNQRVDAAVPQSVMPAAGGDELTVASFNTQHLCDDNAADGCARDTLGAGGALSYANKVGKVADYIRTVLGAPDVVGVQEVDGLVALQAVATRISTDTAGAVTYSPILVEGNDPGGIDVGFLVRDGRVTVASTEQFFKTRTWNDPNGTDLLHDRPPLLIRATFNGPNGPYPFAVMNNHTKARTCTDRIGGGSCTTQAALERDRAKRFTQAVDIAGLVQAFQAGTGDFAGEGTLGEPLILVGDYNAFEYTDGYVDVVGLIAGTYDDDANECNAVLSNGGGTLDCNLGGPNIVAPALFNTGLAVPEDERISYVFTQDFGNVQGGATRDVPGVQVIDHILLSRDAQGYYVGTDYGVANNAAGDQSGRTDTGVVNSSDHDGVVTYLDFDCQTNPTLNPDGDSFCGMLDNCPNVANDSQADGDDDGIGDACDTNTVPLAFDDAASVAEGGTVTVLTGNATSVKANDTDVEDGVPAGDVTLVAGPAHASAFTLQADGTFSYTHDGNEANGNDSFTYSVADSRGALSNVATVNITVTQANDAPTISDVDDVSTGQNQSTTVNFTIADVDSAVTCADVTATSDTQAVILDAGIVVSGAAQACAATLTPVTDASGTSTITLTVSDGTATASDSFVLKVKAQNNAPTFTNEPYAFDLAQNADAGTTVGTVTATDVDAGDALTFSITAQDRAGALAIDPASGAITVADASQMFAGTFGAMVSVTDAAGASDTAAVTITVTALPDAIFADGFED